MKMGEIGASEGTELKPCPFCGSYNINLTYGWNRVWYENDVTIKKEIEASACIVCNNCGASTARFEGLQETDDSKSSGLYIISDGKRLKRPWVFEGTIKDKAIAAWNRREKDG